MRQSTSITGCVRLSVCWSVCYALVRRSTRRTLLAYLALFTFLPYLRKMPFVKTLQFEIGQLLVDEKDLNVDVVSILVKEVLEEVGDGLEGDVTTYDDVTFSFCCCRC